MDSHVVHDEGDIAPHHDEIALGQVLDVGHPPDQGQAIGHQGENRPDQDPIEEELNVQGRSLDQQ